MNTRYRITIGFLLLLLMVPTAVRAQEVPITTQSEEARRAFLEGRELMENLRGDEARERFTEAIRHDPDFALAHLYRGLTGTSYDEFRTHVQHAVDRADRASEGERLVIQSVQADLENDPDRQRALAQQIARMYPRDPRPLPSRPDPPRRGRNGPIPGGAQ